MAIVITNQATINYNNGRAAAIARSNVATALLQGSLDIEKTSLATAYRVGNDLTYMISLRNTSGSALNDVSVTDDLGTYIPEGGTAATPLTYIGPAQLYVGGVFVSTIEPTATAADSVSFNVPSIPAGGNAQILYAVNVNGNASGAIGSNITNTASASGAGVTEPVTDSLTIPADEYSDVRIIKTMTPNPVTDGGVLTLNFDILNYGNQDAGNVVFSDTFDPELTDITVSVNGAPVNTTDYTYTGGTLTIPAPGSNYVLDVPAAQYSQNGAGGEYNRSPGTANIVVTGRI